MVVVCGVDSAYASSVLKQRADVYRAANAIAPKVAKVVCVDYLWWENLARGVRSLRPWEKYSKFSRQSKEYLAELDLENRTPYASPADEYLNRLITDGFYRSGFDQALGDSLANVLSGDMIELVSLRSYFLQSIFESQAFAKEIEYCQQFFSISMPDRHFTVSGSSDAQRILIRPGLLRQIRRDIKRVDRLGYVSGQVSTFFLLGGAIRSVFRGLASLPRVWNYGGQALIYGGVSYILYETLVGPALRAMKRTHETIRTGKITGGPDFTDVQSWARLYNEIIDLRDLHQAYVENGTSAQVKEDFKQQIEKLKKLEEMITMIAEDYAAKEHDLNPNQQNQLQLLLYAKAVITKIRL